MELDCRKCSDGVKIINGCEQDSTMGERWEIGEYKLKRCPIKEITQEGLEYLEAYRFYKQGQLPMQGGWLDQTNTFVEMVGILDKEITKIEKETRKQ